MRTGCLTLLSAATLLGCGTELDVPLDEGGTVVLTTPEVALIHRCDFTHDETSPTDWVQLCLADPPESGEIAEPLPQLRDARGTPRARLCYVPQPADRDLFGAFCCVFELPGHCADADCTAECNSPLIP